MEITSIVVLVMCMGAMILFQILRKTIKHIVYYALPMSKINSQKRKLDSKGLTLTFRRNTYKTYAEHIYNSTFISFDMGMVCYVFKVLENELDFVEIQRIFLILYKKDMITAMNDNLSTHELKNINSILTEKKFTVKL
jgi:hypothetical protein